MIDKKTKPSINIRAQLHPEEESFKGSPTKHKSVPLTSNIFSTMDSNQLIVY